MMQQLPGRISAYAVKGLSEVSEPKIWIWTVTPKIIRSDDLVHARALVPKACE